MSAPPAAMDCQDLVELVTDYLEGALSDDTRRRFEAHVSACQGCANYLEQMRQTLRALGSIPPETLQPSLCRDLLDAFRGWSREA